MKQGERITLGGREWRRHQALVLHMAGWKAVDIARALGVTRGAVSQWLAAVRSGGRAALGRRRPGGRPRKLGAEQLSLLPDCLGHGPEAYGFRGEFWSCQRVAQVIETEFGVRYSRSQVSRLLKMLHWTPQLPMTRALQRDEAAIEHWRREDWPNLKAQARRERKTLILVDESGFYLLPGRVKTYAPQGETPVLRMWQTRDHLSVIGGVTPDGKIYTLVRQQAIDGLDVIEFLRHLLLTAGPRLWVVWDRSQIHRRAEVLEFVAKLGAEHLRLALLPAYAPDLNPAEQLWQHLKHVELRNRPCRDLEELHFELHLALGRARRRPALIRSFFHGAGLGI